MYNYYMDTNLAEKRSKLKAEIIELLHKFHEETGLVVEVLDLDVGGLYSQEYPSYSLNILARV